MLTFDKVTCKYFNSVSFDIMKDKVYRLVTNSDFESNLFIDFTFGLKKPDEGKVLIFGHDLSAVSEKETVGLLRRIGLVRQDGGLISNLKVWENIVLPLEYHTGRVSEGAEERIVSIFTRLGKSSRETGALMGMLCGSLPVYEKRLIGAVRAMLMDPDLIIYDSPFEGLDVQTAQRLAKVTEDFQTGKADRSSLYISSDPQSLKDVKSDIILVLYGKGTA